VHYLDDLKVQGHATNQAFIRWPVTAVAGV
jgi:hypothetical protein